MLAAAATSWPLDRETFWPVLAWALASALGVLVFASVLQRPGLAYELAGSPFLAAGARRRRRDREPSRQPVAAAAAVAVLDEPAQPGAPAFEAPAGPMPVADPEAADPLPIQAEADAPAKPPETGPVIPAGAPAGVEAPADVPASPETAMGPADEPSVDDAAGAAAVNDDAPLAAAAAARAAILAGSQRPSLTFTTKAAKGVQRGKIGYRQVRISAGPDDVRTAEVGRIDRNDEVEVIGEDESFFRIRTPDGVEGWVPRYVIRGFTTSTGA